MKYIEGRFEVKLISSTALAQYMSFRGYTVRTLADRTGASRSAIGHLRSGSRVNCSPDLAKKISKALDCPTEALFVPRVVHIARSAARNAA